jgi:hypothetical protein
MNEEVKDNRNNQREQKNSTLAMAGRAQFNE